MSATRKSSKRTASEAVPQPEIIVVEETLTTVPLTQAKQQQESMLNEAVVTEPAAASAAAADTNPAAAATKEEESTLHKAKKMATEASHQVQVAVTQGLEAAGVALKSASVATTDAFHSAQAKIAEATAPTPTAAQGPYNVKAGDLKPTEAAQPSTLDKAKASLIHASEVIQSTAEHAYDSLAAKSQSSGLTDGVKSASTSVAASVNAAVAQVSAAIQGHTGSEVARDDVAMVDAKTQDSSASHLIEKSDGSLPVERCTEEFPHAKKHETAQHAKLDAALAPGHSGLGTDKVIDLTLSSKTSDATSGSTSSTSEKKLLDTQPDLLTGPALSTHIGV